MRFVQFPSPSLLVFAGCPSATCDAKLPKQDKGPQILATAMAMLDGRRVGLDGLTNEKA